MCAVSGSPWASPWNIRSFFLVSELSFPNKKCIMKLRERHVNLIWLKHFQIDFGLASLCCYITWSDMCDCVDEHLSFKSILQSILATKLSQRRPQSRTEISELWVNIDSNRNTIVSDASRRFNLDAIALWESDLLSLHLSKFAHLMPFRVDSQSLSLKKVSLSYQKTTKQ